MLWKAGFIKPEVINRPAMVGDTLARVEGGFDSRLANMIMQMLDRVDGFVQMALLQQGLKY